MEEEEKGIKHPVTSNKLTQQMYSQAKLEKDVAQVKQTVVANETVNNQTSDVSLIQKKSTEQVQEEEEEVKESYIEHFTIDEEEEPKLEDVAAEEQEVEEIPLGQLSTAQITKIKMPKSKIGKAIKKAEHLKAKLKKLQHEI